MVERTRWIERRFNFDFPIGLFPCIVERLRGTPARLEEMVKSLPPETLRIRLDDSWSLQENIGHLIDVESLHIGRLEDYTAELPILRAADMSNTRTYEADYNSADIGRLLSSFRSIRTCFLERLEVLDEGMVSRSAHHPRLDKPMRLVDMVLFAAEHDDQHLAAMTELRRRLQKE